MNGKILDLYLGYHETYKAKYGEKTAVLCQVGDFFEIYAVINEEEEVGPNIYKLAELLGIQVTRRNKSNTEVNRSNYLMSGFPLGGLQKHIQTLVSNFYTTVVIRQTTPPPNVKREVTEIVSPSMTLAPLSAEANHIMVLMFDYDHPRWICGMAAADVSTGFSMIYQISSTIEDPLYVFDEIIRLFHTCPTKEIVLLSSKITQEMKERVMSSLGLHHRIVGVHQIWDQYATSYNKKEYQEAILAKAGIGRGMLSNHILAGIEDIPQATLALAYLIQFAYEHNPKLVQKLQTPKRLLQENRLTLQYNSALQLNIIGTGTPNEVPLLSILNRTITSFGSRLYRERLLTPILDPVLLNVRYDEIDLYQKQDLYKDVRKHLQSILDLERILRRMAMETYHPCDWPSFHASMCSSLSVAEMLGKDGLRDTIRQVIASYNDLIDLDEASKYLLGDIRGNIFKKGVYLDLDEIAETIQMHLTTLMDLVKKWSNLGGDATLCKLDCNDRDGYFVSTTKKRWDAIRSRLPAETAKEYHARPISSISNTLRITSANTDASSDMITRSQTKMSSITQEKYLAFVRSFVEKHATSIQTVALEIAHIDVQTTNAMNACEYRYVRPVILSQDGVDCFEVHDLRHPIIERIQQKIDYVANDVSFASSRPGLLLYGVNASGKSSLMKAIGLAVIMAQSGMYVPCSGMSFKPYTSIFTRISGNDNIYQGLSSFAVEMTELKHILLRSNERSLVLGDELCAGTEAVSALSIVASGIDMLMKKRASFVFATHLHELLRVPEIETHVHGGGMRVAHMHTEVQDGRIIYDRTLREGSGADTYGIEVCRGLGMPDGFMHLAEKIRKHITNENPNFVPSKQSRYNASVCMDMCMVCRERPAIETHHIRYQEEANTAGFIDGTHIHKNTASNLVPLCSACHLNEHHGVLKIHGWKQTSHGVELDYAIRTEESLPFEEKENTHNIEELVHIWKPYLRYTRKGWMLRKSAVPKAKFKAVSEDNLLEALSKVSAVPSCLVPTSLLELEKLQTLLMDVSM